MNHLARPTVLYIAGVGRSGSTLLEGLLCDRPGYFGVGEMYYLWERGYQRNELCSCGAPFSSCLFWTAVLQETFGDVEVPLIDLLDHYRYLVRYRRAAQYQAPLLRGPEFYWHWRALKTWYSEIYRTVAHLSGAGVIVDSSKVPTYGFFLAANPDLDVRVIHLVRDSRAVAHSWQRVRRRPEAQEGAEFMPRFSSSAAAKIWLEDNLLSDWLRHYSRRSVMLRYEDFTKSPEILDDVLDSLGLPQGFPGATPGETRHSVSGNPSRFTEGVRVVRHDAAWVTEMKQRQFSTVTAATAPMLMRYGYRLSR